MVFICHLDHSVAKYGMYSTCDKHTACLANICLNEELHESAL